MATKLPFLQTEKIPKLRKLSGISKYNFDEDDELRDSALSELTQAIEKKDHRGFLKALHALIDCVTSKEA